MVVVTHDVFALRSAALSLPREHAPQRRQEIRIVALAALLQVGQLSTLWPF